MANENYFKPGIRSKVMHQMGITFGEILGLGLGYAMDVLIDTIDLTVVTPTERLKDNLDKQVKTLGKQRQK